MKFSTWGHLFFSEWCSIWWNGGGALYVTLKHSKGSEEYLIWECSSENPQWNSVMKKMPPFFGTSSRLYSNHTIVCKPWKSTRVKLVWITKSQIIQKSDIMPKKCLSDERHLNNSWKAAPPHRPGFTPNSPVKTPCYGTWNRVRYAWRISHNQMLLLFAFVWYEAKKDILRQRLKKIISYPWVSGNYHAFCALCECVCVCICECVCV